MNEQILLKLGQVVIGANESLCISLDDEDIRKDIQECMHSVVTFSFEGKDINTNKFCMTMEDVWHSTEFTMQRLDTNIYQIFFQSRETAYPSNFFPVERNCGVYIA